MTKQSETKFSHGDLQDEGFKSKKHGEHSFSGHEKNHLFLNCSKEDACREFADVSAVSGLDSSADGRAFAVLDYDRDGDQDIALVNANSPSLQIFRNNTVESKTAGNFVAVRLIGGGNSESGEWSNRSAVGTQVTAYHGARQTIRELRAGEGFGSQNSSTLLIGLDDSEETDLEIRWPSGRLQQLSDVESGTRVDVFENPADNHGKAVQLSKYSNTSQSLDATSGKGILASVPLGKTIATAAPRRVTSELPELPDEGVSLLVTMATWCESCKKATPAFRKLEAACQDQRVRLVGIPVDEKDDVEKLRRYAEKHDPAYTIFADRSPELVAEIRQIVLDTTRVDALPTTVIIRADGTVLDVVAGVPTISDVRRHLSQLPSESLGEQLVEPTKLSQSGSSR